MRSVASSVARHGDLAATFELHGDGHSRRDLVNAVAGHSVIRVRQGWYASSDIHPLLLRAVRVGGRLSCLSALDLQGAWSFPADLLHVTVGPNSCRLRTPHDMRLRLARGVNIHWRESSAGSRFMLPPMECLIDVLACQQPDATTAVADSVLHTWPHLRSAFPRLLLRASAVDRQWLAHVDGLCESGTESLVWFRMRPFRLPMRRQVGIAGVGRVDFLVGMRLVIEVDGAAYHTDTQRFEADRHRDAVLSRLGYRVLRFSYRQVVSARPEVEAAIVAAVIRGDHHRA